MAEKATLPHDTRYHLKTPVSVQPYFQEDMTLRYQNWGQRLILNIGTALSFHPSPSTLSHSHQSLVHSLWHSALSHPYSMRRSFGALPVKTGCQGDESEARQQTLLQNQGRRLWQTCTLVVSGGNGKSKRD